MKPHCSILYATIRQNEVIRYNVTSCQCEGHLEEEGVGVVSQLAQQLGLDPGVDALVAVLQRRVHLPGGQEELPAEGDAHHVHVVPAVAEGAGQRDEHCRTRRQKDLLSLSSSGVPSPQNHSLVKCVCVLTFPALQSLRVDDDHTI